MREHIEHNTSKWAELFSAKALAEHYASPATQAIGLIIRKVLYVPDTGEIIDETITEVKTAAPAISH